MASKWKYTRLTESGVSKWVMGKCWVTRFDDEGFVWVGLDGVALGKKRGSPQTWMTCIQNAQAALANKTSPPEGG